MELPEKLEINYPPLFRGGSLSMAVGYRLILISSFSISSTVVMILELA